MVPWPRPLYRPLAASLSRRHLLSSHPTPSASFTMSHHRHLLPEQQQQQQQTHSQPSQSHEPQQQHPPWLQSLLADSSPPPKLYAWTPANLDPSTSSATSPSSSSPPPPSGADDLDRRIFVLGVGNIGRLYASHLARHAPDPPPITLVVHRPELLAQWAASDGGIEITTLAHNSSPSSSSQDQQQQHVHRAKAPFDIEFWSDAPPTRGPVREVADSRPIRNLLIATKASAAMPQADRLRRYLDARSAVAFAQNGMSKLWPPHGLAYVAARYPRPGSAPSFLACITGHGVYSLGPFRSVHASPAGATVGPVLLNAAAPASSPSGQGNDRQSAASYLTERIASAPGLDCRAVPSSELWLLQLEKLVVNSSINPVTAILRCKNGALFESRAETDGLARLFDRLLGETSAVLQALVGHPSTAVILRPQQQSHGSASAPKDRRGAVSSSPDLEAQRDALRARFSHARLRDFLYDYGSRVGDNTSSMLQDVRAGKPTEVRDFNGWIVDMADFLGMPDAVPMHRALVGLVEDAAALTKDELAERVGV